MKRATPMNTKQEIAQQLITEHHKEQEAKRINMQIQEAREIDIARPRIGPKDPIYLPYKENNTFY